ncbi:hypothetical protein BZA77DRAFT_341707 [Pyronema omphalodes]|nr:hypothetical protein BZA77DRAFT_341707 [Pyronema omphalodes]
MPPHSTSTSNHLTLFRRSWQTKSITNMSTIPEPTTSNVLSANLGNVGPLLQCILSFISSTLKKHMALPTPVSSFVSAKPILARFRLWAMTFDCEGYQLDNILAEDDLLKETVVLFLSGFVTAVANEFGFLCDQAIIDDLRETIAKICPGTLQNFDCFSDEDTTGSEDSQTDSTHLTIYSNSSQIQELESIVNSLFDLSPILESAAERIIRRESMLKELEICSDPQLISYVNIIRNKFPNAEKSVVEITAQGALNCWNRLFSGKINDVEIEDLEPVQTRVSFKESQHLNTFKDSGIGSSAPQGTTTAASYVHDPLNSSGILHQDMDFTPVMAPMERIALRAPTAPTAPSIISETTTTSVSIARLIPSRPKVDSFTGGFICPLCKIHQNISSDKTWEKHVFMDLEPYMCFYKECDNYGASFSRLHACMDHYRTAHSSTQKSGCLFKCQAGFEETSDYEWHKHLGKHMKDILLLLLPISSYQPGDNCDKMLDDSDMDSSQGLSDSIMLHRIVEEEEEEEETGESDLSVYKALKSSTPIDKAQLIAGWRDDSYIPTTTNIMEGKGKNNIGYPSEDSPSLSSVTAERGKAAPGPAFEIPRVTVESHEAAPGLTVSVLGAFGTLIKACLEGYRLISTARSADKNFENHRYQFSVEQQKLKDITTIVIREIQDSTHNTDGVRLRLICSILIRIAQQFSDFKQLESLYGIQVTSSDKLGEKPSKRLSSDKLGEKPSKRFSIREMLGFGKSARKVIEREVGAFEAVLNLTDLQLDENLEMTTLQTLESPLKRVIGTYLSLKTICVDSKKVQTLIAKLEQYNNNMRYLVDGLENVTDKPHFMVPYPRNENFVGKSYISSWFEDYRQNQIISGQAEHIAHLRLALYGLAGVGKTQDVLSFIYEYENKRPVFWINAGSITQFKADYRKLRYLAKIPGNDDTEQNSGLIVKRWLESPESGDWILVLDNADNMLDSYTVAPKSTALKESNTVAIAHHGIANFIPRSSKGIIIVTTRDREVARNLANQNVIVKPALSPQQAIDLFYHHCRKAENATDDTNTALQRLLKELQYLPLAIVQVAAYHDQNISISTSEYLKLFERRKESPKLKRLLLKPYNNFWWDDRKNVESILTTFSISFDQIQEQSTLADSFLRFMACINRKAIPRDLLFQIHLDDVEDIFLISEALDKLVNFSILQHAKVDFGSGKAYEIHSLVYLAMQTYLGSDEMGTALKKASEVLSNASPDYDFKSCNASPDYDFKSWATWRHYLPHVTELLENLVEDSKASADLCLKVGRYLIDLEQYSESLQFHERARRLYASLRGVGSAESLRAMRRMESLSRHCRLAIQSQQIKEKKLEVRRRTLGEDHPDTLGSMRNLAITLHDIGDLKGAISLMEKTAYSYALVYGSDHSETKNAEETVMKWKDEIKEDDGKDAAMVKGAEDSGEAV